MAKNTWRWPPSLQRNDLRDQISEELVGTAYSTMTGYPVNSIHLADSVAATRPLFWATTWGRPYVWLGAVPGIRHQPCLNSLMLV